MTECEELAEALLPLYLKQAQSGNGVSIQGIKSFVFAEMSAYESINVMDQVIETMIRIAMPERIRSDGKLAHAWIEGRHVGFRPTSRLYHLNVCRDCGVVQDLSNVPETPCKGLVRITTRNQ